MVDLCETCRDPGHCCRRFYLATAEPIHCANGALYVRTAPTALEALVMMARRGWPFVPLKHRPFQHEGVEVDAWLFTCPLLDGQGRCSDYENRPTLCRDFVPGSDPLCAHYGEAAHG